MSRTVKIHSSYALCVPPSASRPLLTAALAGLLCVTPVGCSDESKQESSQTLGGITHSEEDPDMTLEKFTALCDKRGGTVEQHPHCGGVNSCKGMSYDETTQVYTEHT